MKLIYTVTSILANIDLLGRLSIRDKRCVGWYDDINKAKNAVEKDVGGLCESYYNYLVIEETPEGIYGTSLDNLKEVWYHRNDNKNCWVACEKPEGLKHVIAFGIG